MFFTDTKGEKIIISNICKMIITTTILILMNTILISTMVLRNRAGEEEVKKENGSRSRARQSYDLNQVLKDDHDDVKGM